MNNLFYLTCYRQQVKSTTCSFDDVLILLEENWFSSLSEPKWLKEKRRLHGPLFAEPILKRFWKQLLVIWTPPGFFQLFTWTSQWKSLDTAKTRKMKNSKICKLGRFVEKERRCSPQSRKILQTFLWWGRSLSNFDGLLGGGNNFASPFFLARVRSITFKLC